MIIAGAILIGLAAAIHVYIFVLESIGWTGERARRIFRMDAATAATTRPLAYNQGFYNLFLAVDVAVGLALLVASQRAAGLTALLIGAGSMVAASVVLVTADRSLGRAAAVQGVLPALGLVLLLIGLAAHA